MNTRARLSEAWIRWRSPDFRHERYVALYAVAFVFSVVFALRYAAASPVSAALYLGIGIATIWSQVQVARESASPRTQHAWLWLAFSSFLIVLGGTLWTYWPMYFGRELPDAMASWAGGMYVPFAAVAFLMLPSDENFSFRDRRAQIETALLFVGSLALSWHFGLRPSLIDNQGDRQSMLALSGGYFVLIGECVVSLAASLAFVRASSRSMRTVVGIALAGHLVYVLSDFFWTLVESRYKPGNWVDLIFFVAWVLRWIATRTALHQQRRTTVEIGTSARIEDTWRGGIGASIFVVCAYALLLLALTVDKKRSAIDIALVVLAMTGLLLLKQRLAREETERSARRTAAYGERFRALLARSADFVLVADSSWHISYASPSLERVAGPLLGREMRAMLHPDDWPHLQDAATRSRDARSTRPIQLRLRALDGKWRDVELRMDDHRHDPLVRGYVVNGRDITAEVDLEQQLGHARKLVTLSEMAGRIAHAFNNALAALVAHAELLMDELEPDSPAREDVRAIRVAAERGAGITRQLLGFSGRHVIRPEHVRLAEFLTSLRPTLARLLPASVAVQVDVAASAPTVFVDRAQFEQVLLNLVANARDAMPTGGTLTLSARADEDHAIIQITDTGVGMSESVRSRIFEPFFTTKPPGRGTGLGLAMVGSIVKRAAGEIDVETAPGCGTIFSIRLPSVTAHEGQPAHTSLTPVAAAPAINPLAGVVLLVDDDAPVRRATRRMLERAGYEVVEAADGATAIDLAAHAERRFDALLTDLMMPEVSGRDVIEQVRVLRPHLPIVCITGFAAERDNDPTLSTDVFAIVAKPFSSTTLIGTIASAIRRESDRPVSAR